MAVLLGMKKAEKLGKVYTVEKLRKMDKITMLTIGVIFAVLFIFVAPAAAYAIDRYIICPVIKEWRSRHQDKYDHPRTPKFPPPSTYPAQAKTDPRSLLKPNPPVLIQPVLETADDKMTRMVLKPMLGRLDPAKPASPLVPSKNYRGVGQAFLKLMKMVNKDATKAKAESGWVTETEEQQLLMFLDRLWEMENKNSINAANMKTDTAKPAVEKSTGVENSGETTAVDKKEMMTTVVPVEKVPEMTRKTPAEKATPTGMTKTVAKDD